MTDLKIIGKGQYGSVVAVRQQDDEYALKMSIDDNPVSLIAEIDAMNKVSFSPFVISYQAIVNLWELEPPLRGDYFGILMPRADMSLHDLISRREWRELTQTQREEIAIQIGVDLLLGLAALHSRRIIHNDLKPDNVLVTLNDDKSSMTNIRAQLADLGISINYCHQIDSDRKILPIQYTAPELYYGGVSYSNDVFSLGCILYEMVMMEHLITVSRADEMHPAELDFKVRHQIATKLYGGTLQESTRRLLSAMTLSESTSRKRVIDILRHPTLVSYSEYINSHVKNIQEYSNYEYFESTSIPQVRSVRCAVQTVLALMEEQQSYFDARVCLHALRLTMKLNEEFAQVRHEVITIGNLTMAWYVVSPYAIYELDQICDCLSNHIEQTPTQAQIHSYIQRAFIHFNYEVYEPTLYEAMDYNDEIDILDYIHSLRSQLKLD